MIVLNTSWNKDYLQKNNILGYDFETILLGTKILGYDFEIVYKKGKQNVVVDALSRKDEDVEAFLCAISIIQPDWIIEARDEWKNNEKVWTLIQRL